MLYAAELVLKMAVRLPGAERTRRISPGSADSKLLGAVYHGSCEGGVGNEGDVVGRARVREKRSAKRVRVLDVMVMP